MADLTQTAANVAAGASTLKLRITGIQAGEAITQGQPVYQSTADSKFYRCDADAAATAIAAGIAMTPAATNGYFALAQSGDSPGQALINLGATLTVGQVYVVSTNPGGIAPIADLGSGDFVTILGVATTTALLDLRIVVSNTAKA